MSPFISLGEFQTRQARQVAATLQEAARRFYPFSIAKLIGNIPRGILLTGPTDSITVRSRAPSRGRFPHGVRWVTGKSDDSKRIESLKGENFEMKRRSRFLLSTSSLLALVAVLIPFSRAFAQDEAPHPSAGAGIAVLSFIIILGLAVYAYIALAVQTIARKTDTPNDWFAWIPIANIFLLIAIAKKPLWWFVLFLVPIVNVVIAVLIWMGVAEARNKPSWWGILMLVPVVSLIVPGYLAWSD